MWQDFKNIYHLCVALAANVWYGFPSKNLTVIGVTGTDGKTTTTNLIYHILRTAGKRASMISTIGAVIGEEAHDTGFHVTNPSSWPLQRFIKEAAKQSDFLVLEVTSHGLHQHRVFGVQFMVGVITNITHEHLDYHRTHENYVWAKAKLLNLAKIAIINKDDNSYSSLVRHIRKNKEIITYGMSQANVTPSIFSFTASLLGEFNMYNCLAAIAACKALGIKDDDIRKGISTFKLPKGRAEIVYENNFKAMIDFAHTPNAFEKLLASIRPEVKGRLIHMFSSAGQRDATKRPLMGEASSAYADIIILTSEDPRTESPVHIMDDIEKGINSKTKVYRVVDRQEAINQAVAMAEKGDFIVLTGKAHEKSMNMGRGEEPWDEYDAVQSAIKKKNEKS